MVDTAGGRSQWSHLSTATVVLLVLLFFTRPLSFLPNAVLVQRKPNHYDFCQPEPNLKIALVHLREHS